MRRDVAPSIWVMRQSWSPTLFVHWEVPAEAVRGLLPQTLHLDTWEGRAYVSLVVVEAKDTRPRGLPSLPGLSLYRQLNLRTYVSHEGRSGLFFFGTWLTKALPALVSSLVLGVPARRVGVDIERSGADMRVDVTTNGTPNPAVSLRAVVDGEPAYAPEGSLEEWLHERYRGYAARGRSLLRLDVRHRPWRLSEAHLEERVGGLEGVPMPLREPSLVRLGAQCDVKLAAPYKVGRATLPGSHRRWLSFSGQGA